MKKIIQTQQTNLKFYLIVELKFADLGNLQQTMARLVQNAEQLLSFLKEPPLQSLLNKVPNSLSGQNTVKAQLIKHRNAQTIDSVFFDLRTDRLIAR